MTAVKVHNIRDIAGPFDKSNPPPMMTNDCPIASRISGVHEIILLRIVYASKKLPDNDAITATIRIRRMTVAVSVLCSSFLMLFTFIFLHLLFLRKI